jgi:hypothetical protein
MYGRTAIFKTVKQNNRLTLTEFIHGISSNMMYESMTNELIDTAGFIRKDFLIVDDKTGCTAVSRIVFENEENFNNYLSNEMYEMIWEYLQVTAEGIGIKITFEDGNIDSLR